MLIVQSIDKAITMHDDISLPTHKSIWTSAYIYHAENLEYIISVKFRASLQYAYRRTRVALFRIIARDRGVENDRDCVQRPPISKKINVQSYCR